MAKKLTEVEQYIVDFVLKTRLERKLTQEDIGFILGVDRTFIYQVENQNHRAKYNVNHINLLADHWGISPRKFLPEKAISVNKPEDKGKLS
ncbi:helix-turn-helix domain-containing protein [Pedobacter sp. ASV28]|uniref:helix-turn-helix domain-containing protein n=1 Tax=Pedobacter sp. ASV28 TaxID=2795123 RepID=UPI0018EC9D51|nr:helix-turn-helix transcriptional regulator [Pedobacter sp. ASV28]